MQTKTSRENFTPIRLAKSKSQVLMWVWKRQKFSYNAAGNVTWHKQCKLTTGVKLKKVRFL